MRETKDKGEDLMNEKRKKKRKRKKEKKKKKNEPKTQKCANTEVQ